MGLCRLLHTLLHVGLNRGRASVVFLHIAAAFDEVVQSVIQTVADRVPRGVGSYRGTAAILQGPAHTRGHCVRTIRLV